MSKPSNPLFSSDLHELDLDRCPAVARKDNPLQWLPIQATLR